MKHKEDILIQKIIDGEISVNINNIPEPEEYSVINTFDTEKAWNNFKNKVYAEKKRIKETRVIIGIISVLILILLPVFEIFTENYNEVKTLDNISELTLPDNSVVTLNKNTEIEYFTDFNKNRKIRNLKGEAFFDIKKNPEKPFVIEIYGTSIKVTGTSFNVKSENGIINVTVKTGTVEMKTKNQKITLKAGETGISKNKKLLKKQTDKNYLAWKTRFFTYENEKLKNIIKDINEVYGVNIKFKNPQTGNLITGKTTFDNYDIYTVLEIICKTHNLKYKKTEKNTILLY